MKKDNKSKKQHRKKSDIPPQVVFRSDHLKTEHKQSEDRFWASSLKYQGLFETSRDGLLILDADTGEMIDANPYLENMLGYPRKHLLGKFFWELDAFEDIEAGKKVFEKLQYEGHVRYENLILKTNDGRLINVEFVGTVYQVDHEKVIHCNIRDITERKHSEDALRESEEKYRRIVDTANEGICVLDADLRTIFANARFTQITGYQAEEIIGRTIDTFLFEEDLPDHQMRMEKRKQGIAEHYELRFRHKDGHVIWTHISATPIFDAKHHFQGTFAMIADITGRKQAEEALRKNELFLKRSQEAARIGSFIINIHGEHESMHTWIGTPTLDDIFGIDETYPRTGESLLNLIVQQEEVREYFNKNVFQRKVPVEKEIEFQIIRPRDGEIRWILAKGEAEFDQDRNPVRIIGTVQDITERKRAESEAIKLESQLAQTQKMEALGTLAGGIAHDFNNILAAIIGYTELAMHQSELPEKVKKYLEGILLSGKRARDLVSQVLTFSRQSEEKTSLVRLGLIIEESLSMLRSVMPSNIEIRKNLTTQGIVMADSTQILQMMMNLCSNAEKAMSENGGVLEVNLEKVIVNNPTAHALNLSQGSYLRLTVKDTGRGMTPELISRIFEPYFTTRDKGKGTGLGLSIVHGIVTKHNGVIICKSEHGKGTVFEIYLPEIELGEISEETHEEMGIIPLGSESILFIDDEPALGDIAKNMLENLGYRVMTRKTSEEALDLFTSDPDQFDLVITDMTMPGMTGYKLAQKIMEVKKDIPIILCTGYSEYISKEKAEKIGIREFIMKPFEMKEMAKTIRKVLDKGQ